MTGGIKRVLDEIWDEVLSHGFTDVIVFAIHLLIFNGQNDMRHLVNWTGDSSGNSGAGPFA